MKRVDLGGETRAFVYGPDKKVEEMLPTEALKLLQGLIGRGVVAINTQLEEIYKQPIHGIYIALNDAGKVFTTLSTSQDVTGVEAALRFVLSKIEEANNREKN